MNQTSICTDSLSKSIVIVTKEGKLKPSSCLANAQAKDLYKLAGFKKQDGFNLQTAWKVNDHIIQLFGKTHGNAGYENKYDFPPPVDNQLFFGSCVLVVYDNVNENRNDNGNEMVDLTIPLWKKIYEHLFGGFESLDVSDNEEEVDELQLVPKHLKTKQGYLKDGFVVDSPDESVKSNSNDNSIENEDSFSTDDSDDDSTIEDDDSTIDSINDDDSIEDV